jgi:hypothetical protein
LVLRICLTAVIGIAFRVPRKMRPLGRARPSQVLLVDLAELLFQFGYQSIDAFSGDLVGRLPCQRPVPDDFHFELNTVAF